MATKLKENVYKTVTRTAMLYGSETCVTTKRKKKTGNSEARFGCYVTRNDDIRMYNIRWTTIVADASEKDHEARLLN